MKIAYVMYPGACFMGAGDGTKMQAVVWKECLERKGHRVDLIDPWGGYDWKQYDIVHVFGLGLWNYDFIHWGSRVNRNFVFSPIIDSNTNLRTYKLATYAGCRKLRLFSQNYMLRKLKEDIRLFFARTHYEAGYLTRGYGIPEKDVSIVPLSYRFDRNDDRIAKEPFCLFAGTMTQERKNVSRLIRAAIKYRFKLVLAGNTGNDESLKALKTQIGGNENIEIRGFVSEDELANLYNRAKVFALASINEGVGLVALEAAVHRCNIVTTRLGGPKEYYNGKAYLVDPYDVDDIGRAVLKALEDDTSQPDLREHVIRNYSTEQCVDLLVESYRRITV